MAGTTKKFSDRVREMLDALAEAVESLLSPQQAPVPVPIRYPRLPTKRRR